MSEDQGGPSSLAKTSLEARLERLWRQNCTLFSLPLSIEPMLSNKVERFGHLRPTYLPDEWPGDSLAGLEAQASYQSTSEFAQLIDLCFFLSLF